MENSHEVAQGAQAGEFKREDRYIVIKRKDLDAAPPADRERFNSALLMLTLNLRMRECLVIESDWPEYGPTWAAIQARVEGRAALATQPAAGEPKQQTAINADDLPTKKYPLGAFDFDAPVAAGDPVAWECIHGIHVFLSYEKEGDPERAVPLFRAAPPAAAHGSGLHFSTTEDLASAIRQVSAYEDLGPELIADEMFKQAGASAAHGDEATGTVRVTADWLKKVHRDLDACQKVIWLAGCRPRVPSGFDPAYCEDAQARLKEIDEHIARAQGDGGAA